MKISEILLPKNTRDTELSSKQREIDVLKRRISAYTDKISNPSTPRAAREFLKVKLQTDCKELRKVIHEITNSNEQNVGIGIIEARGLAHVNPYIELMQSMGWFMTMNTAKIPQDGKDSNAQHELRSMQQQFNRPVINGKTFSEVLGDQTMLKHPKVAAALLKYVYDMLVYIEPRIKKYVKPELQTNWLSTLDKLKNQYKAAVQFTSGQQHVMEAVHKLPITNDDFEVVKQILEHPVPAVVAPIYIAEIIDDDEFNDLLKEFEEKDPGLDMRPHIVDWIKRVMPDQLYRFKDDRTERQRQGILSPLHGYDPHMYHGSNDPITGNAYGRL